jgi:uncharacterized membrane protein
VPLVPASQPELRGTTVNAADIGVSEAVVPSPLPFLRSSRSGEPSRTDNLRVHRVFTVLGAIGLFGPAIATSTPIIQLPLLGLISVLAFAAVIAAVLVALLCRTESVLSSLDLVVLGVALVLLGAYAASQLYFDPVYGTDEAAFVQYAAQLLQHGHNPYTTSMLPSLSQFQVPIQYATYLLNGSISSAFAYPSLSFLMTVPFVALTHGIQAVIVANACFLAIEMLLVFAVLPRRFRALAPVAVLGLPILFGYTVGGVVDTLFVPFLVIVAYRWTDVGKNGRLGAGGIGRAVCLGMAASISQFPWFVAPFVVIGLWRLRSPELGNRRALSLSARYAGVAAATGIVINAPFILWAPGAWLRGVTTPLLQHAVPFGQGIVAASVFFRVGGGNLAFYTYAASAIFLAIIVVYTAFFHHAWRVAFVLPSVVLFFPARSLTEYVVTLIAVWIVSLVAPGNGPDPFRRPRMVRVRGTSTSAWLRRNRQAVRGALLAIAALVPGTLLLALALTTPAPMAMKIVSVSTNGQFERVWQLKVQVTNRSHETLDPHFTAHATSQLTPFWTIRRGPARLEAGRTGSYTLVAPNVGSMPFITQPFIVQAVTPQPETISSSQVYTPQSFSCYITPSYIDQAVPLGHTVTLQVQLRSPFGSQVRKKGVTIALGQIIYGQTALIPSEAEINGALEGQTPVTARTNSDGVAIFRVRDDSIQGGNPVYLQAYVDPTTGFPYAYSEIVSIIWH